MKNDELYKMLEKWHKDSLICLMHFIDKKALQKAVDDAENYWRGD